MTVAFCLDSGRRLSKKKVNQTAKHEVHEMVVADFAILCSDRFTSINEIERVRHTLVRRMDNVIR